MTRHQYRFEKLISELCPSGVEFKKLGEIIEKNPFKQLGARELEELMIDNGHVKLLPSSKNYNWFTDEMIAGDYVCDGEVIAMGRARYANIKYWNGKFVSANNYLITSYNPKKVLTRYLYHFILNHEKEFYIETSTYPKLDTTILNKFIVPVPPLAIQEEIVKILDNFTNLEAELEAELEARKKQYEHYYKKLLKVKYNVKQITLNEIGKISMCKRVFKNETSTTGDIPFYKIGTFGKSPDAFISQNIYDKYRKKFSFPKKGDILLSASGTIGRRVIYNGEPAYFQDSNIIWIDNNESKVLNKFLYYIYATVEWKTEGGTIKRLYNDNIKKIKIPVPSIVEQEKIVAILDKFDALVNDISIGLPAELKARRQQYEYYRNKLLTFKDYVG